MRHLALATLLLAASVCGSSDHRQCFSDPAQLVEVRVGGEFELALTSIQSTGYQ